MSERIIAAAAIILAAAAAWFALKPGGGDFGSEAETTKVLAARVDLPAGTQLTDDLVEPIFMPRRYMQAGAYELRAPADISVARGLVTAVRIPRGDQITDNCLVNNAAGAASGLADKRTLAQVSYVEGLKYFQDADYAKARAEWTKALRLDPKNADAAAGLDRIAKITAR